MAMRPPIHRPFWYVQKGKEEGQAERDKERGSSAARGYGGKWQKARATFLSNNPICVACLAKGFVVEATVVDHIVPHKGDMGLFWDSGNWQALCKACHDRKTAAEDGGFGRPPRIKKPTPFPP